MVNLPVDGQLLITGGYVVYSHTLTPYFSGVVMKADPLQFSLHTTPTADPPVFILTCVSTGGPATTVNWTRDGAAATGVTSQTVVDQEAITYNNTLTVTGRLLGDYQCSVANVRTAQPAIASLTVAGECDLDVCLWKYVSLSVQSHRFCVRWELSYLGLPH